MCSRCFVAICPSSPPVDLFACKGDPLGKAGGKKHWIRTNIGKFRHRKQTDNLGYSVHRQRIDWFWKSGWLIHDVGSRINFSTTFPAERQYLQILLCFSSNPSNLVGKVFLCGRSWPQLQIRNEGTPPDFEHFFLEKRPWKRFPTNVLIRGEMNPLHKHKIMSVGYQVKQISKSRSWTHV